MDTQLGEKERELLAAIQRNPRGMDTDSLLKVLPGWDEETIMVHLNQLSARQYVDFITTGRDKKLAFRAKDTHEILATAKMTEYERIIYRLIKEAKGNGIWIKDLKTKSGMHHQLATATIKSLEKQSVIKSVRPVKTPFKRVYLLFDVDPSAELTGGAWYTDNELDVDFIEQLSGMILRYVQAKSLPRNADALYAATYARYPTVADIHRFIEASKITTFKLRPEDVASLVDRLYFEGKIVRVVNPNVDNDNEEEQAVHAYKAIRGMDSGKRSVFSQLPLALVARTTDIDD